MVAVAGGDSMPFYDYVCLECGKVSDRLIPMALRDESQVCPECGGKAVRKVISRISPASAGASSATVPCTGG